MRILGEALLKGDDLSHDQSFLYAYGIYLMNGGTPDDFMDMTPWDVQVMLTAYTASVANDRNEMLKGIATIASEMMKRE